MPRADKEDLPEMPWNQSDINSAEFYSSRPKPLVQKPAPLSWQGKDGVESVQHPYQVMAEAPVPVDDFVYDADPHWNSSVQALETVAMPKRTPPFRAAAEKAPRQNIQASAQKKVRGRQKKEYQNYQSYFYVVVIVVCLLAQAMIMVMMMPQLAGYFWKDMDNYAFVNGELLRYDAEMAQNYKQYRDYLRRDTIYPGVFVDGIHVGDMTVEEAREALSGVSQDGQPGAYSVTVAIGNRTWTVDDTNVPATRNLGNILERAYAIGRTNAGENVALRQTPFRERVNRVLALREKGVNLAMGAQFQREALENVVREIAQSVNRPAQNAEVAAFDFNTRTFSFTDGQVGVAIDAQDLYEKLADALSRRETGTQIQLTPVVEEPVVTKAQLTKDFRLISAYTTDTTNEKQRNNNIDLASRAINGTALMPGDVFSFNETTGQRTIAKGYQEAGAISGGQSIEEVGGGICQVSSTLFNAAARANLEIVSRSPHAWPSTYVNRGEDATVNWPNLDFKFKNNTQSPIFVITYFKDRKCSAEIWGMSLGDGVSIDLHSDLVQTIYPPNEVNYVNNMSLPYGTSKETIKARNGYVVDTYKVWYQNGTEMKREKMQTTTYRAYQRVVEYN